MFDNAERPVSATERRMRRTWLEDGLDDLMAAGLALAVTATLVALKFSSLFFPVLLLVIGLGPLAQLWLFARLKERIADPRTGHVRPRILAPGRVVARLSQRSATLIAAVCLAFGIIPFFSPTLPGPELGALVWSATLVGSAILAVYIARSTGLRRLYLYALVPLVVLAGWLVGLDDDVFVIAWLVAFGSIALVGGSLALHAYLRAHPLPVAN